MAESAQPVQLAEDTLLAFREYITQAETAMDRTVASAETFLWSDSDSRRAERVREGKTLAELWSGNRALRVPEGLIHDWIGTTFVPAIGVRKTVALVQDYDNHKRVYNPEVTESKLIGRSGNDFEIYLRLLKKKIVTVVLDTYHDVHYLPLDRQRWSIRSRTTRVSEVENAGKKNEKVAPPDAGYGYLWRLNSYWRLFERDGGTYIECRAVSLTRDVPKALAWIIEPMVKKLPRQSLIRTLEATRSALTGRAMQAVEPDEPANTAPPGEHACESGSAS